MLNNAESYLYRAIGGFSTVAQPSFVSASYSLGYVSDSYFVSSNNLGVIPSQCFAFLSSSYTFTWFIEKWTINRDTGTPVFQDKKVYPAKVTGLSIPYPGNQTLQWRDGLIDNRFNQPTTWSNYCRPGFGETILGDLNRPMLSASITANNLGLGSLGGIQNQAFAGPFGRLMSMAFYVDPELAAKYDTSQSKKKKKSLNSQDYEQMPTYPTYTVYSGGGGYGG